MFTRGVNMATRETIVDAGSGMSDESGRRRDPTSNIRHPQSTHLDWIVAAWVAIVLAAATLLLCRAPGSDSAAEAFPPLIYLATILTIPLPLTSIADLRMYALPIGAAGLLLIV